MALQPFINTSLSGNDLTVTDTTVYGGAESDRSVVLVDFSVVRVTGSGSVSVSVPTYAPATVTSILLESLVDGHYQVTMTINDVPNSDIQDVTGNVLVYFKITTCLNEKRIEWGCACCEAGSALEEKLYRLDAVNSAIVYAESVDNYSDAQCIIERAQPLCEERDGPCPSC